MEMVLTVPAAALRAEFGSSDKKLICADEGKFVDFVLANREYVERARAEADETKKQVIAYLLVRCGDETFMTRRLKGQTEKRLRDRRSVGVGGHINSDDGDENPVYDGMMRELFEEVEIPNDYERRFLGIINDDSTEVGKVHVGLCYEIILKEKSCAVKEVEKTEGCWADEKTVLECYEDMENWSKIALNTLLGLNNEG